MYIVEDNVEGVWEVENVLETENGQETTKFAPYTLQIEVDNTPGVLNQVSSITIFLYCDLESFR